MVAVENQTPNAASEILKLHTKQSQPFVSYCQVHQCTSTSLVFQYDEARL